jgi:hypothetical protein
MNTSTQHPTARRAIAGMTIAAAAALCLATTTTASATGTLGRGGLERCATAEAYIVGVLPDSAATAVGPTMPSECMTCIVDVAIGVLPDSGADASGADPTTTGSHCPAD